MVASSVPITSIITLVWRNTRWDWLHVYVLYSCSTWCMLITHRHWLQLYVMWSWSTWCILITHIKYHIAFDKWYGELVLTDCIYPCIFLVMSWCQESWRHTTNGTQKSTYNTISYHGVKGWIFAPVKSQPYLHSCGHNFHIITSFYFSNQQVQF